MKLDGKQILYSYFHLRNLMNLINISAAKKSNNILLKHWLNSTANAWNLSISCSLFKGRKYTTDWSLPRHSYSKKWLHIALKHNSMHSSSSEIFLNISIDGGCMYIMTSFYAITSFAMMSNLTFFQDTWFYKINTKKLYTL